MSVCSLGGVYGGSNPRPHTIAATLLNNPPNQVCSLLRIANMVLVREIQELMKCDREILIAISRTQNKIIHWLAAYGHKTPRAAVWLGGLDEVVELCKFDASPYKQ